MLVVPIVSQLENCPLYQQAFRKEGWEKSSPSCGLPWRLVLEAPEMPWRICGLRRSLTYNRHVEEQAVHSKMHERNRHGTIKEAGMEQLPISLCDSKTRNSTDPVVTSLNRLT